MNFLYVSCICSSNKFQQLFEISSQKPAIQGIKYNKLLAEGIASLKDNKVETITALQMNRKMSKQVFWRKEKDFENNVYYRYIPFLNFPIVRHISLFFFSFLYTLLWRSNKEQIVICDVLSLAVSAGAFLAAKIRGINCIGLVTDIPAFQNNSSKYSKGIWAFLALCIRKARELSMERYDAYIVLTKDMNSLVNPKGRPFIVIEGIADKNMIDVENNLLNKHKEKIIMYAGALNKKYGIKKALNAFMKTEFSDARFYIYGKGEMDKEILEYEKLDSRIKYFGMVQNKEVVQTQLKVTLLINPRPSCEEFTRYSFPSKNIEYMASGTPLLTTKLPGMPKEYYDYVYLFEDENEEGMYKKIQELLSRPKEELHEKGKRAKEFVMESKTNINQANRINQFVRKCLLNK